ncbi:hypothetical protein RIF29_29778 [Crotalaria pallida]|uniref:Glycosyltransferase n=1 Tax=Crotalaria pallida TaxID=3830 RepID=A0AAN9EHH6_CROPI
MASRAHCIVLAYPSQGHINPMLQFSKLLEHEGVRITLVTTFYYLKKLKKLPSSIALETISDGYDDGFHETDVEKQKLYFDRFREVGSQTLGELIEKLASKGHPVDCVIYDSFLPWTLDVTKKYGIVGAVYLTQNMTVNSIYYHFHLGKIQLPLTDLQISIPTLPPLQHEDMPSFFFDKDPALLEFLVAQFSNVEKADWILCNTFYELEKEVTDWKTKIWPKLRTIGPSIPSMFLDKRLKDDVDYGVSQFTSEEECMTWLDDKPKDSVVYISFGSLAVFDEEQTKEIACGLEDSGSYFLWVVRASEEAKLPKDFGKKTEKGLVVTWCPQMKVLAHEAVGCFVTHCGWNSTLEALCIGVPTIAMPYWSDQSTNAKCFADVWKTGIRAPVDEKKIVRGEALKLCINEVMDSERGKEMKNNAMKWKILATKAVGEGGSSHKNIKEFVNSLFGLQVTCPESQNTL